MIENAQYIPGVLDEEDRLQNLEQVRLRLQQEEDLVSMELSHKSMGGKFIKVRHLLSYITCSRSDGHFVLVSSLNESLDQK